MPRYVGVPYGPKSRLIMIHLQTEGLKSRTVNLGASFSAFMRSLGLAVTGGKRGTIGAVREQALRIAQCRFTMQWDEANSAGEGRAIIANTSIVDGLELWRAGGQEWAETVELSEKFHAHLREHAVPLDKRASPTSRRTAWGWISTLSSPTGSRASNAASTCAGAPCRRRLARRSAPRTPWRTASARSCLTC
ncbi:MAG: hypothetical protein JOY66_20290 [Acetobacteraceae bacterium]|nr:hypothetical protein [Acetobacteraceae bacterium]